MFTSDLHGHRPFYESTLDLARSLRARAILPGGDLAPHGHVHESPAVSGRFADRVGGTICVNPGQHPGLGLHAAWLDLADVAGTLTHTLLGPARL